MGTQAEPDLAALCAAAAAGDADAAQRLFVTHHERLMGLAVRRIGADWRGKIEAEDVLQDAYAAAWGTIGKFEYRGEDSFFHWMARIVDERFLDRVRGLRRKKRDAAREAGRGAAGVSKAETLLGRLAADETGVSRVARKRDAGAAVMAALATLPEDYRKVVERVYLDQAPMAEVAAEMGRSEDAVRRMAGRAVAALREGLGRASRWLTIA